VSEVVDTSSVSLASGELGLATRSSSTTTASPAATAPEIVHVTAVLSTEQPLPTCWRVVVSVTDDPDSDPSSSVV
jgi:hypothetical protein